MHATRIISLWVLLALARTETVRKTKAIVDNPMKGKHFKLAYFFQPGSSVQRDKNGTVISFTAPPMKAAEIMSKKLGFTYEVVLVESNRLDPFPNGSWGGPYGLLVNKKVDFIFAGMALTHAALRIVDFTSTVHEEPLVMALPTPQEESRFSAPVKPFSLAVWMVLFATVLAVCWTISGINAATERNRRKEEFDQLLMYNVRLLLGQGGFEGTRFVSVIKRVALAGWLLSVLVLVNAYTGSFISAATTPRLARQPQTLQEAVEQSVYQYVAVGNALVDLYLNARSGPFKILGDSLRKHPENIIPLAPKAFDKVLSGCCFMSYPRTAFELYLYTYYQATGKCDAVITKKPWVWDYYAYAAPKGSPCTPYITKVLFRLKESGIYFFWLRSPLKRPLRCLNPDRPKVKRLTLVDVASLFLILGVGLGLSCAVLVCEFAFALIAKKYSVKL